VQQYNDPNAVADAPVKREILLVLLGFVVMTAIIAVVINKIIS
jgi:hypothetical protein